MRRALIPILSIILILLLSTLINFRPIIQPVKAQQQPNQAYSDNFNADSGLWQYLGSAYRDPTNDYIVLTNSGYDQAGIALFNYPIQGPFTANFTYKVGGGSCSGDGFTMFFYKQQYSTPANGGDLAFSPLNEIAPGYGIEFDGWQNIPQDFQSIAGGQINPPTGDPSSAYIGLIEDSAGNHLTYVNDQTVDDNNWHQVSVIVADSSVSVLVDQALVLQWVGVLNRTYNGFGFSGATGGTGDNWHIIGNFSVNLGTPESIPTGTPTPIATVTPAPTLIPLPTPASATSPPAPPVLKEPNQSIGSYSDDFSADSGLWQYFGSAYRDPTNQDMVLTNSGTYQAGVALFNYPIQESFTANFTYKVGGGSYSGDGFTMFFYKQPYSTFDNGGNLGFNSQYAIIPGYGIEFDGWQNPSGDFQSIAGGQINPPTGDPSNAYIGLIEDFVGNHLAYVNDQRVDDNNWHQVSVQVQGSSVSVYVDKGLVLQWTGVLNRTYDGFGFSGGNGEVGSNYHIISNFSITAHNLQTPSLTTSCISSVSQSSLNVNINGFLTSGGTGISGAPILFSYSVTGGESWQDLTLVNTGSDGSYSALWFPPVTGNYLLKAVYEGNENYSGTSNVVNFAMAPGSEQSVFSVTSNSTLSELSFNSTNKELSFSVSGELGTMGYVNVDVPKSLINDISGVEVYLDNNKILYTAQSQSDCWILYFTYHHSTHNVAINLGSPTKLTATSSSSSSSSISPLMSTSQQSSPSLPIGLTVAVVIMVVMAVAIGAFSLGKRTERNKTRLADYQI